MVQSATTIFFSFVIAMAGFACCKQDTGEAPPEATKPAESPAGEPEPGDQQDPDIAVITITGIDLDPRLAEMCGIPRAEVFFKFDSAKVRPEAKERLDKIASCAKTGEAKGEELVIIGRAGPIGSDEYNQKLGMSRAESVAQYLGELGVQNARIETKSKGEEETTVFPSTWPYERRVSIRLQP